MNNTPQNLGRRLLFFLNPNDGRYEDLVKGNLAKNIFKDLTAGLIVAAVAIPLAMGLAMAPGLQPEQGIGGAAVAGLFGALFGGSKYQMYVPTAAFIPFIAGLMATYSNGFLVLAVLMALATFIVCKLLIRVSAFYSPGKVQSKNQKALLLHKKLKLIPSLAVGVA